MASDYEKPRPPRFGTRKRKRGRYPVIFEAPDEDIIDMFERPRFLFKRPLFKRPIFKASLRGAESMSHFLSRPKGFSCLSPSRMPRGKTLNGRTRRATAPIA
jgi:hypothetical protein